MEKIGERLLVYGSTDAENILLMPMDLREMEDAPLYEQMLSDRAQVPFSLLLYRIDDWNRELSPWPAPPVYGKEPFSGEAEQTLETIRKEADSFFQSRNVLIGGYSLAGFFALWAAYQTDLFTGVAAVSPSLWYPGWIPYAEGNSVRACSRRRYSQAGRAPAKERYSDHTGVESGRTLSGSCAKNGEGISLAFEHTFGKMIS